MQSKKCILGLDYKLFIAALLVMAGNISIGVASKQGVFEMLANFAAVIYISYLVSGKRTGLFVGIVYVAMMSYVFFSGKIYGMFIYNAFVALPIMVMSTFSWRKNSNGGTVKPRALPKKYLPLVAAALAVVFVVCVFLFGYFGGDNIYLDSFTTSIAVVATVFMYLRLSEQWIMNIASNLSVAILWTVRSFSDPANIPFAIIALVYSVYAVYGLVNWTKLIREADIPR